MRSSRRWPSSLACSNSGLSSMSPGWAASFMRSAASMRRPRATSRSCLSLMSPSAVSRTGWVRSMLRRIIPLMASSPNSHDALLVVDPQVDFCPGGALAVPGGDQIFPAVNQAAARLPLVVASRDWHPPDHVSFAARGGPWPEHCRAGTPGAEFHPDLDTSLVQEVFSKGTDAGAEAYSAFDGTGLAELLRSRGVNRLYVEGQATDV